VDYSLQIAVLFRSNELCNPTHRACVIAKHHAPSFACPRLAAEWSSQNGRHERAVGRGTRQWSGLPDPACNGDNDVAVLNGRYRDFCEISEQQALASLREPQLASICPSPHEHCHWAKGVELAQLRGAVRATDPKIVVP
jgi:hypothetical protein